MTKISKTNAIRQLDSAAIKYSLVAYKVDENDLSAIHVAKELGQPVEQLFKTLVLRGDKTGYFVCIVPGDKEVDLKKAAKVSGNKNCQMIPMKDLLNVAGYIRGACSPIGMKKQYPTYIHNSCTDYDVIFVSAGKRGLQIQMSPTDLIDLLNVSLEDLTIE